VSPRRLASPARGPVRIVPSNARRSVARPHRQPSINWSITFTYEYEPLTVVGTLPVDISDSLVVVDLSSNMDDGSTTPHYDADVPRSARRLDEREQRAWRALQMMQRRLSGELARQLADEAGLSYQDYLVLVALTDRRDGRMRLFELGEVLGWEKSRLSHHVARMTERGLVKKEKCASDRRGAFVVVTEAGRKEIEAAAPGHVAAVRRLFIDRLTARQLDAMAEAAETVLAAMDRGEAHAS
jgi:DNA-binding MarR family transcriptional regulator